MQHSHRISEGVARRFRALDRRLHIDHQGRSEWIWAVPIATFAATFALIAVGGAVSSGITPAVSIPIGLIVALATAGMSVAYMTPETDGPGDDRGHGGDEPEPQPSPPRQGWARWLDTWHDEELPTEPPAPQGDRPGEREHTATRR